VIKSARLHPYEAHSDTLFEFCPGINCIIGDSDKGKSGSMRGMMLVPMDYYSGISHVPNNDRTPKGSIKSGCGYSVTLVSDKNIPVTRFRNDKHNGWTVGDHQSSEAMRGEIPSLVASTLNMSAVNVQRQLDPPFLIGRPSTEVARFLNSLVKLDDIDVTVKAINSKVRKNNDLIDTERTDIDAREKEIETYSWVSVAKLLVEDLKSTDEDIMRIECSQNVILKELENHKDAVVRIARCKEALIAEQALNEAKDLDLDVKSLIVKLTAMLREMEDYKKATTLLQEYGPSFVASVNAQIGEIKEACSQLREYSDRLGVIKSEIANHGNARAIISSYSEMTKAEEYLKSVRGMSSRYESCLNLRSELKKEVDLYIKCKKDIDSFGKKVEELIASLPEVCPVCGGKYDKHHKESHS